MDKKPEKKPLQVLLTQPVREIIEAAADRAGMPLGTYMRAKALEAARIAIKEGET